MNVAFEILEPKFVNLNGGPLFKFKQAMSFQGKSETQVEGDYYCDRLSEGGDENAQQCGWLRYKYWVSRQAVSTILSKTTRTRI